MSFISNLIIYFPQVIIECQKHDDYEESIKWLLRFAEEYAQHGRKISEHGNHSHGALTSVRPVSSSSLYIFYPECTHMFSGCDIG